MSASVMSEAMIMNPSNVATIDQIEQTEVEYVKCDCCGLTEECTLAYIQRIRERYQGKWICGLCAEAVKYEMRIMNTEEEDEALNQHMSFCNDFRLSSPPTNPAVHLISALRNILRRSLDSPGSTPRRRGRGGLSRPASYVPSVSSLIALDESSPHASAEEESEEKM
ncbi:putative Glycosyltransferase QUASIMODO1 [Heracleum sosnowskyi]|uniref:Glycosyltransferase QUASIMODO1 n=1 Tax=Heracleum sosnowskyi TaxID=360622 RepID=A0AAD8I0M5_9APIA|nr:putative Glycosyltransferase QUASIMODO1 [Heracleum sosnowskyi]